MPPIHPGPNDPDFASPKGYQFQSNNPKLNCCWLGLVDTSDGKPFYADRMFQVQYPKAQKTWVPALNSVARNIGTVHRRGLLNQRGIGM